MIPRRVRLKRIFAALRLVPVLAWLAIQLAMNAMPLTAQAETQDPELQALFDTLGVERIELCTPQGKQVHERHGDHTNHAECGWCQAFASTIVPELPFEATAFRLSEIDAGIHRNVATHSRPSLQTCHPSRAPPVLI